MDLLKGLSTPLLTIAGGVVIVVLALSDKLDLGPLKYSSNSSTWTRIGLVVLGAAVIVVGGAMWFFGQRAKITHNQLEGATTTERREPVKADDFFVTLDEVPGFHDIAVDCARIEILSRTGVNLLSNYARTLTALCNEGCEVRLIYVDPESPSAFSLYGSERDAYLKNLESARHQLERLASSIGPRLSIRLTRHSPPFSLIHIISNQRDRSMFRVQLNFMHSRIGRDRPVFTVGFSDTWYQAFRDEFDATWTEAEPYSLT